MIARSPQSLRSAYESLALGDTLAVQTRALRVRQLRWWQTYSANPEIASIATDTLRDFQTAASNAGLSADTVETTINMVMRIVRASFAELGLPMPLKRPKRLVSQPTKTARISLADFNRFLEAVPQAVASCRKRTSEWWLSYWGMVYFTALRNHNIEQLESRQIHSEMIVIRQYKTGVLMEIPIHPVLRRMIGTLPRQGRVLKIDRKSLYRITARACQLAGVKGISPQSIRALSARQFERAHPGAGRLILGRPLHGADASYLVPFEIVSSAIEKLVVPPALMTPEERERAIDSERLMLTIFRQLSRDNQATLMTVAMSLRK